MFYKVALILVTSLSMNLKAWTPDTTKIFWNKDFIIEFGYSLSYVSMYNLNKYYIDDYAKPYIFNNNFHFCTFLSPEFGLVFTNNIISVAYQHSFRIKKGNKQEFNDGTSFSPNLYVSLHGGSITYRHIKRINKYLISFGGSAMVAKCHADVTSEYFYELHKNDIGLNEGFGGGGSLFIELNQIFLKYIIFNTRLSANVFLTETLKDRQAKWIVYTNDREINLDYSGLSLGFKIGFLL